MEKQPQDVPTSGKGHFFAVDWRCVGDATRQSDGVNVALAYLTLARHTSRNHQSTTAAATAIAEKLGLTRGRADLALRALQNSGLISTPKRGTFRTLTPWALVRAERTKLTDRQREVLHRVMSRRRPIASSADPDYQVAYGLKQRDLLMMSEGKPGKPRFVVEDPDMVWLPNSLVDGFGNGAAPLAKLRQTDNAGAVQLLIDIYRHANLPEHGGLPWNYVREKFHRVEIDRFGAFTIWGFASEGMTANWEPLFTQFAAKGQEAGSKALWAAFGMLKDAGLIEVVNYLVDGLGAGSMPIHPYALPGTGEPEERAVQEAAHAAGLRTARDTKQLAAAEHIKMDRWLCPIRSHVLGVQMIGIVRPVHRAHTKRTAAWRANFLAHCDTHTQVFSLLGQSQARSAS